MKKSRKNKGGLRVSFLCMTLLPILTLGLTVLGVAYNRVKNTVYAEVNYGMQNVAYAVANTYETLYPGEYAVISSETLTGLTKGNAVLTSEYLRCIKVDTGQELSLYYGDVRYVTTLLTEDGQEAVGTTMNSVIRKRVIESDEARFFTSTYIYQDRYFAYYMPLHDTSGEVIGALEILKPAEEVDKSVSSSIVPILVIDAVVTIAALFFTLSYAAKIRAAIDKLLFFLKSVEKGDLKTQVDQTVAVRKDEIGEMARAASSMQSALKSLVEKDSLTHLYNRRHANRYLKDAERAIRENGTKYSLCIGDIDFFKKVNDTYGHDAGDQVLVTTAGILTRHMLGKGMVARWGGEEFLFVFEDRKPEEAADCLNRILDEIRTTEIAYGEQIIRYTMSFGVTGVEGTDIASALKLADQRLYYAKEHGRNQVVDF